MIQSKINTFREKYSFVKFIKLTVIVFFFAGLVFAKTANAKNVGNESVQIEINYQKPYEYHKTKGKLVVKAELVLPGQMNGISLELDGESLAFNNLNDGKLEAWLPLVGESSQLVIKRDNQVIQQQLFYPLINSDWDYFNNGTIHIVSSSHQDIAWVNTPDTMKTERIHNIMLPALETMEDNPEFKFGMEQTLNLMELMDERPDMKDEVIEAYKSGQFSWGATFNQPYEGMESSEQLVRQLYLGRKWILDNFKGMDAKAAFNIDVPARTPQFPQMLSKSGVKYLVISRFKEGFHNWNSPDGSEILTYSPGNYGWAVIFYKYFDEDAISAMHQLQDVVKNWNDYYRERNIPPHYSVVISNDAEGPQFYKEVMNEWNAIVEQSEAPLPTLQHSTAEGFLEQVDVPEANFDEIEGERPNLWLYIHGPGHYEAIKAKRASSVNLPAAEMFATFESLLSNSFDNYNEKKFQKAWYNSIYPDHGWGGKNGNVTDSTFKAMLIKGNEMAKELLNESLENISKKIKPQKPNPIVVFNALSWDRSGEAEVELDRNLNDMQIVDTEGEVVPSQVVDKEGANKLSFRVDDVPSAGYKTYYLQDVSGQSESTVHQGTNFYENEFYRIQFGDGGIKSLYDKELDQEIINSTRLAGGDILEMGYNGNGAGEFTQITEPNMQDFDKLSTHESSWSIKETGDLFTTFEATYVMNGIEIIQRIKTYHHSKKIDFQYVTPHWDGRKNRQLRFAVPMNSPDAEINYDVPMGVMTVGESELDMRPGGWSWGGTYWQKPEEIHPREIQNFISANNGEWGMTLSTDISVADWIDPIRDAEHYPVLQSIMLSTHKSCHGEGNWYLQDGKHVFNFRLQSHNSGWQNGYPKAVSFNNPFYSVNDPSIGDNPELPASLSFVNTNSLFHRITALKKSSYDDGVVLRIAEMEGENGSTDIEFFKPFHKLYETNMIEQDPVELDISGRSLGVPIDHNSIKTLKLKFRK